ncbi:Na+/alanine symporter [[Eubacterium] contortum]|uniref:Na+/alanine symporter n=1 Tax=Faecalicatena contorta TaxID=39482 RepID=A0A174ID28_9FIRM|nr:MULTISPECIES: alanine/glycine:cation symporter family protein [Clostridia]CUO83517.1 Na+/alanine symporter [[Eubacterium] contortum] [Faecalicatena contorta]
MEKLNNLVLDLGGNAWNLVLVLAIFLGVFYGIRTKFIQIRLFPEALRLVKNRAKEGKDEKGVSSFQALCITLGGCIGTGNVAGVAMAIVVGGPGAVFWMWLIAILGMVTSFMENTLAQVYKVQEGEVYRGGPSYYMEKGLGKRWLGILYAFSMIVSLGFALAALQSNTISLSVGQALGIPALLTSILVAVLIALVIFGGVRRIAKVAERGVPIMTLVYFALALLVLIVNIQKVPEMFALIFSRAFDFKAVGGAAIGTVIYQGLKRGVFSNGAGQGDAPTAGASAEVSHPAKQGLFGVFSVFIDTILVCTLTAFVIIISGVHEYSDRVGIELSQLAFSSSLGKWAGVVLMLCIFMFCFTSIMSNYYCGESCLAFMAKGMKGRNTYRIIFVTAIFLGGITGVDLMWNIADLFCAIIVILNMISLIFLGKKAIKVADDYIRQKKEGKDPVFCSKGIKGLEGAECWGRER